MGYSFRRSLESTSTSTVTTGTPSPLSSSPPSSLPSLPSSNSSLSSSIKPIDLTLIKPKQRREKRRAAAASTSKRRQSLKALSTPQRVLRVNYLRESLSSLRGSSRGIFRSDSNPGPHINNDNNNDSRISDKTTVMVGNPSPAATSNGDDTRASPAATATATTTVTQKHTEATRRVMVLAPPPGNDVAGTSTRAGTKSNIATHGVLFDTIRRVSTAEQEGGDRDMQLGPNSKRDSQEPAKKRRKGSVDLIDLGTPAPADKERTAGEDSPAAAGGGDGNGDLNTIVVLNTPVPLRQDSGFQQRREFDTEGQEGSKEKEKDEEEDKEQEEGEEDTAATDEDYLRDMTPSYAHSVSSQRTARGGSRRGRVAGSLRKVMTGRVSKFREGSMRDRVSQRPPEELLGYAEARARSSTSSRNINSGAGLSFASASGGKFYNTKGEEITGKEQFTIGGLLDSVFSFRTMDYCRDNWWGPARKRFHERMILEERKERGEAEYKAMKARSRQMGEASGYGKNSFIGRALTTPNREAVQLESIGHKRKYSQLNQGSNHISFNEDPDDYHVGVPPEGDGDGSQTQDNSNNNVEGDYRESAEQSRSASRTESANEASDGSTYEDSSRTSIPGISRRGIADRKGKGKSRDSTASSMGASLKKRASKVFGGVVGVGSSNKDKERTGSQPPSQDGEQQTALGPPTTPGNPEKKLTKREIAKQERLRKKVSSLEVKLLETWKELEAVGGTEGLVSPITATHHSLSPPPLSAAVAATSVSSHHHHPSSRAGTPGSVASSVRVVSSSSNAATAGTMAPPPQPPVTTTTTSTTTMMTTRKMAVVRDGNHSRISPPPSPEAAGVTTMRGGL